MGIGIGGRMKNCFTILLLGLGFAFVLPLCRRKDTAAGKVRYPVRAGEWYPGSKAELAGEIRGFLSKAAGGTADGDILAIWVPHAGYTYSGQTAAHAYKAVEGKTYDAVVLIGPSHYVYLDGATLGGYDTLRTPLGDTPVDAGLSKALERATPFIKTLPRAHEQEHSIEVQFPFIQTVLPGVPIVPLVIGQVSMETSAQIAKAIAGAAKGKRVLVVASSDMSHFPSEKDARMADGQIIGAVGEFDPQKVFDLNQSLVRKGIRNLDCALCGSSALITAMLAAREMGADRAITMPYSNSYDMTGDPNRVVGYGSAVFIKKTGQAAGVRTENQGEARQDAPEDIPLTRKEKQQLLDIARESIAAALKGESIPEKKNLPSNLLLKRGVFVTLMNRGQLRGCIGRFGQEMPLAAAVQQMAAAAAVEDYRFAYNPVTLQEMGSIDVKISILSELRRIQSIDEIVIGRHGIWVKQGRNGGTYLPEVAVEQGWNREEFLSHCCAEKAGLSADAWKKGAEIYVYSSQIIGEKE
jgi:AmmeMemoRadiSam system protein B/AmmeMemoRadiSam system protein A